MERLYLVEIAGREWRIRIDEGTHGQQVTVDDGPSEAVDFVRAQGRALYSLLLDGQSHELRIAPDGEQPGTWQVSIDHMQMAVGVQTERERRLRRVNVQSQAHSGELLVKAPMPGLVREVAIGVGAAVQAGQRLVVLEAMKMENDIGAPRGGTVKAIRVAPGDTVEQGRPLVVLE